MSSENTASIVSPKLTERKLYEIASTVTGLKNVFIRDIIFATDTKKGDSYLSSICRFTLDIVGKDNNGQDEHVSLSMIVKSLPKNLARRKTFRSTDFFENEVIFFNDVWPAILEFQKSKDIEGKLVNIPHCYSAYSDGTNDYIALEDLNWDGYNSLRRYSELDVDHTLLILRALAKFHGLALAFKDQKPEEFENAATSLKETYYSEKYRKWIANFQGTLREVALDAVEKELPSYYDKVKAFLESDLYGTWCKSILIRGPFAVIAHGDLWIPNFLFLFEQKRPVSVAIVDFQLTRYASLSTDLLFFLYTCVTMKLLREHWQEFIEEYFNTLKKTALQLGSELPWLTMDALEADLKDNGVFGVGIAVEGRIMSLQDDDSISDLDGIEGDQEVPLESVWVVHPFKEKYKRKDIAEMFRHAINMNLI